MPLDKVDSEAVFEPWQIEEEARYLAAMAEGREWYSDWFVMGGVLCSKVGDEVKVVGDVKEIREVGSDEFCKKVPVDDRPDR